MRAILNGRVALGTSRVGFGGMSIGSTLAVCLLLLGCGGSPDAPITASSSKYQAVDDDEAAGAGTRSNSGSVLPRAPADLGKGSAGSRSGRGSDAANSADNNNDNPADSGSTASRQGTAAADRSGTARRPATDPKGSGATAGNPSGGKAAPSANQAGTKKSSGSAAGPRGKFNAKAIAQRITPRNLPDGTPDELLAVLDELRSVKINARSREEYMERFGTIFTSRMMLAEQVFRREDANDDQKYRAAYHIFEVLRIAGQNEFGDVVERLFSLCQELEESESPRLRHLSSMMICQMLLEPVAKGSEGLARTLTGTLEMMLAFEPLTPEDFEVAMASIMALEKGKHTELFSQAATLTGKTFDSHPVSAISGQAKALLDMAVTMELKFPEKMETLLKSRDDESVQAVIDAAQEMAARRQTIIMLSMVAQGVYGLEAMDRFADAELLLKMLERTFSQATDRQTKERLEEMLEKARTRAKLMGTTVKIAGTAHDDRALKWEKYADKVVLVYFWSGANEISVNDLAGLMEFYEKYKDKGFEVVSVNVDDNRRITDEFLKLNTLPFVTLVSSQGESAGMDFVLARQFGVEVVPYGALIDREGKLVAMNVIGQRIIDATLPLLGISPETTDGDDAGPNKGRAAEKEKDGDAGTNDAGTNGAGTNGAGTNGAGTNGVRSSVVPRFSSRSRTVKPRPVAAPAPGEPASEPLDEPVPAPATVADENPYAPRADLTPDELREFILAMREKPKSIQVRKGFDAALVEAADRLLAAQPEDKTRVLATIARLETLHRMACGGDTEAEKSLAEFVDQLQDDPHAKIAREVRFLQWERRTVDAEQAPVDSVPALLAELKEYLAKEPLNARHLRLASNTVRVINRIEDDDAREKLFAEFGGLFARSSSKELARYGKQLAKSEKSSELVGKPVELSGRTVAGSELDWKKYQGRVVIVDFWATWCGPCIREMPHVKALYDNLHDKGLEIVGVNLDKDPEAVLEFLDKNPVPWETLMGDETQAIASSFGVRAIPTMLLVDREGKIAAVSHNCESLIPKLEKLLEGPGGTGGTRPDSVRPVEPAK
ncbi:MAG: redoxin domain-containing protein [Planctomycetes bacterium]|nr:redoxin domain-containing protein [Planctomycetota bacterium]